ncbi:Myelin-associated oligodendrocyte basic protein isoform 2 [Hibiscus syriacus]|uniref:Myelin-associated oligodendrocyte basic protein isoform 2 n=1 Tax=Hibiscus syriacus TaxID=106335 RepID=A0A6A3CP12_HIBSY|nr:Myelin-associated oligodendrocyte basic protein isoform 2 [Hibiscus syriacus]
MATSTSSLLQSNTMNLKNSLPLHLPPLPTPRLFKFTGTLAFNGHRSAKFAVKCFFSSEERKHLTSSSLGSNNQLSSSSIDKNPFEIVAQTISRALNVLKRPAIAAVLLGLLLMYDPNNAALAALVGGWAEGHFLRVLRLRGVIRFPGMEAFVLVSGFLSDRSESSVLTASEKTTVLKLQVGLLGMGRTLQKDLNRIAKVADTSTSEGLSFVLTETTLALLRHPDYCISGYSSVDVKRSIDDGEKRFNQLSIEERGKFDEETLVNVNNIKRQSTSSLKASGFSNEYIVITILVAAEGVHKFPAINGSGDLKEALQKLASIPSSKIMAVEVLWTPQNEDDTLSERELLEDYPLLRPL